MFGFKGFTTISYFISNDKFLQHKVLEQGGAYYCCRIKLPTFLMSQPTEGEKSK